MLGCRQCRIEIKKERKAKKILETKWHHFFLIQEIPYVDNFKASIRLYIYIFFFLSYRIECRTYAMIPVSDSLYQFIYFFFPVCGFVFVTVGDFFLVLHFIKFLQFALIHFFRSYFFITLPSVIFLFISSFLHFFFFTIFS